MSENCEWNNDQIERLRALWAEGLTTILIARRMGISKNAIVGKAHRLGLEGRPSPTRPKGSGGRPRVRKRAVTASKKVRLAPLASVAAAVSVDPVVPAVKPVAVKAPVVTVPQQAEGSGGLTCQFIKNVYRRGEKPDFCGAPCVGSWCVECRKRVFVPGSGFRARAA